MKMAIDRAIVAAILLAAAALSGGAAASSPPVAAALAAPADGAFGWSDLHPSFDDGPAHPAPAAAAAPAARAPAAAPPMLPLPGPFPPVELRTVLVAVHLVGLCFGLGGSTLLYFWILRWIRWGHLPDGVLRTFDFVAKTVAVGLVLLWLSGLGFLASYWLWEPAKLGNPKLWAKLVMVLALSLNGLLVHGAVSPFVHRAASGPLLRRETALRRLAFIASGTVSGTSWYGAFALGLLHEFNGKVPAGAILGAWALAMAAVFVAFSALLSRGGEAPRGGSAEAEVALGGAEDIARPRWRESAAA